MEASERGLLLGVLTLVLCAAVLGDVIQKKEGQDVEFPCTIPPSYKNARVEWKYTSVIDSSSASSSSIIFYGGSLTDSYKDRAQYYPQGLMLKAVTQKDGGEYTCEVTDDSSGKVLYTETKTTLQVLVPPSVPVARVPSSVTIGSAVTLSCLEGDGFPRPTITWYKNKVKLPDDPKTNPNFQNATYTLNPQTGDLTFDPVTPGDTGEYSCEAFNALGRQVSAAVTMEAYEKNVGGIVAAVIVVLIILGLIAFGMWFAYSRGYIGKKTDKKVIYSQPSETRSDKNFQQTSSFVV